MREEEEEEGGGEEENGKEIIRGIQSRVNAKKRKRPASAYQRRMGDEWRVVSHYNHDTM